MKLIGNLLIWIFIATGLIAATSFYVWPVGADPSQDARFEIGTTDDGSPVYAQLLKASATSDGNEIAPADADLNPAQLDLLRKAGIERVIVKHPAGAYGPMLANWSGKWLFVGSAFGLILGGMMLRVAARREVADAQGPDAAQSTPEELAGQIRAAIADLRGSLPAIESRHDKEHAIINALGEVQGELIPAFAETRAVLISNRGMGGFAGVMDQFAGMERQINRSWSAAADNALEESTKALEAAAVLADQLAKTLGIGQQ
jgi:hypothetical protein